MLKSIRQVAVIVNNLEEGVGLYAQLLGLKPSRYGELPQYGLKNAILPVGEGACVEFLQPTDPGSPGARFIQRRGEGMYLLVMEVENLSSLAQHLREKGVRITEEAEFPTHRSVFVHPLSVNGTFMELAEWRVPEEYRPVETPLVRRIRQVAILVRDLEAAASRWEELFGLKVTNRFPITFAGLEAAILPLKDGETFIELAQPVDPNSSAARYLERHGEGLWLLIFQVDNLDQALAQLRQRGAQITQVSTQEPGYSQEIRSLWLHPRSMKGVFIQLSEVVRKDHPWPPAGDAFLRRA